MADYQAKTYEAQRLARKLDGMTELEFKAAMAEEVATGRVPPPRSIAISEQHMQVAQNMSMWEYADGTVVRYKPQGDLKRSIAYSIEVKVDPALPDVGPKSAAFKVGSNGVALPKNETAVKNPFKSQEPRDRFDAYANVILAAAHGSMEP